ncbi:DUF1116 domain-containing protein [Ereboglobus luteus]|uniref:DUF1116 domain-containing protein n=1 Tax=Ereboglobus luteus TaxID=1796921 RepID=A0A2U8E452_9BACT|nr:DUF1116 domain-containing protein [Ereboglobus luteus]AWI09698.1 hypothetical protein CKA38_10945 [Ereboglobus luteus]
MSSNPTNPFVAPIKAVNIGAELFADGLREQGVEAIQLKWQPPPEEVLKHQSSLAKLRGGKCADRIAAANARAIDALLNADPHWIDMKPAIEVVPGLKKNMILKSGPPLPWEKSCPTQKNGVINGIIHEGLADTAEGAIELIKRGEVEVASANDYAIVGPGAGILTPSMVVNVVEDRATGKRGFCAPFEGPNQGGLCGWGTYSPEIRKFLNELYDTIGPMLSRILRAEGGIAIRPIIRRGVEMGDETHTRQDAEGLILINQLLFLLMKHEPAQNVARDACVDFLEKTERFFHPIGMASAMATVQSMKNIEGATVVTTLCGNGVEYGIKISALGDQWFTAPSPQLTGQYIASDAKPEDTLPWIGDSSVLEAIGLGGFAAAASPAVARLLGHTYAEAIAQSRELAEICLTANRNFLVPALDYNGSPAGIDILKVLETGIQPAVHGGMISKTGLRVGAGVARVPLACFGNALEAYTNQLSKIA